MKESNDTELKDIIEIHDESLRLNRKELDKLHQLVKNKPSHQKLLFAQGGIQSSIQEYKKIMCEITTLNQDMMSKLCQLVYHCKQVRERIEHISQYQNYQTDYQKFYKNFSADVNTCQTALMKFLPEMSEIELLLAPLTDIPENEAMKQVVKFNSQLNEKLTKILQKFEEFKTTYLKLLEHEKPLKKLMHLCDLQQSQ